MHVLGGENEKNIKKSNAFLRGAQQRPRCQPFVKARMKNNNKNKSKTKTKTTKQQLMQQQQLATATATATAAATTAAANSSCTEIPAKQRQQQRPQCQPFVKARILCHHQNDNNYQCSRLINTRGCIVCSENMIGCSPVQRFKIK